MLAAMELRFVFEVDPGTVFISEVPYAGGPSLSLLSVVEAPPDDVAIRGVSRIAPDFIAD